MIHTLHTGTTSIYVLPIDTDATGSRRERERAAVSQIIKDVLGAEAKLTHDAEGAPLIAGYKISISHSSKYAVVALDSVRKIGIDAEEIRPTLRRVRSRFLSAQELALFTTDQQLLAAWTIKEAVYKIVGKQAVEFSTAIHISPDMLSAQSCGIDFSIIAYSIDDTRISLAVPTSGF